METKYVCQRLFRVRRNQKEVIGVGMLTDMEKKAIREKAETLLKKYGDVYDGEYVRIVKLSKHEGFTVGKAVLAEGLEGIIAVDKQKDSLLGTGTNMVIAVDHEMEKNQQRFTIAHELGHYILRKDPDAPVFAHRETTHGKNEEEDDADYFAACLLMPKKGFKAALDYYREMNENAPDYTLAALLSKQFMVPELAALRRISEVEREND